MKKRWPRLNFNKILFVTCLFIILLLSLYFAGAVGLADLDVKPIDKGSTIIAELEKPSVFDLIIKNNEENDSFEIYSFVGVSFDPKKTFEVPHGTKTIEIKAYPSEEVREKYDGFYTFEYFLIGRDTGSYKDSLTIKIVPLAEVTEITLYDINVGDDTAKIRVRNIENISLTNLTLMFDSAFFNESKDVSLKPYGDINISVKIDKNKTSGLRAGRYDVSGRVSLEGASEVFRGAVNYIAKQKVDQNVDSEGLIVRRSVIEKVNSGNVDSKVQIDVTRNILTRLFTDYSPDADKTDRRGLFVDYIWDRELQPGESFAVRVRTNYTFPFILLLVIILAGVFAKIYTKTALVIDKRVSYVNAKGADFALKIVLKVRAKNNVDNVSVMDKLPFNVKLYEKFGRKPDKIDHNLRALHWNLGSLRAGEEKVISYIIYSKLKVVGRFELPIASATFENNKEKEHVSSNKAYFVAEMKSIDNDY